MEKVNLFATTKSNLFILEIGRLIAAGFRDLGCESELLLDRPPVKSPSSDTYKSSSLLMSITTSSFRESFIRGSELS